MGTGLTQHMQNGRYRVNLTQVEVTYMYMYLDIIHIVFKFVEVVQFLVAYL